MKTYNDRLAAMSATTAWAYIELPSILANRPPKARGRVRVRLTRTQAISDPATFELLAGQGQYIGSRRYHRKNGIQLGCQGINTWRIKDIKTD